MIRSVLGSRASIGGVLGSGRGGAAAWYLAGGVTPVAAYQPIGAVSLAASYTNLANPGMYDAAAGVAPTFDTATGWTFNTTQYLTTGLNSDTEPMCFLARVTISAVGTTFPQLFRSSAAFGATLRLTNATRYLDLQEHAYGPIGQGTTALTAGATHVIGFAFLADRTWSLWIDGVADKTGTYSRLLSGGGTMWIGATSNSWNATVAAAAAWIGTVPTAAQVAAVSAAMSLL